MARDLRRKRMRVHQTKSMLASLIAALALLIPIAPANAGDDNWTGIRKEFFAERPISEETGPITIEAPDKAEDSAVVPVTVLISPVIADKVTSLHLFIDNNPMPLIGHFTFGSAASSNGRTISTRVRFDSFSYIRGVIETADGKLYMATKFVQAAGGCSAPAFKDFTEAMARTGEMHLKKMEKPQRFASQRQSALLTREAQVMLRHPNYSGMQMDQTTGQYIPARYVREIEVKRGDELIMKIEAGISLSTNPNFRFTYATMGDEELVATAKDSDGQVFNATAPADGS